MSKARSRGSPPRVVRAPGTDAHSRYPRLYDRIYERRVQDVLFYLALARSRGRGGVLELGAGNGRVALAIAAEGIAVTAVERSKSMLASAERKRAALSPAVRARFRLCSGDLRQIRLERRYPLIIAPFNVLMHMYDRRDFARALATVRAHLAPGGVFAFDVRMPPLDEFLLDPRRTYPGPGIVHPSNGARYRCGYRFQYDPVTQIQHIQWRYTPVHGAGKAITLPLKHRQYFPEELLELLHSNGFAVTRRFGDFSGRPLDGASLSQVLVARLRTGH